MTRERKSQIARLIFWPSLEIFMWLAMHFLFQGQGDEIGLLTGIGVLCFLGYLGFFSQEEKVK